MCNYIFFIHQLDFNLKSPYCWAEKNKLSQVREQLISLFQVVSTDTSASWSVLVHADATESSPAFLQRRLYVWLSLPHSLHSCQHGETFYRNILLQNCTWNIDVGNAVKYADSPGSTLDKGPFYSPKLSQAFIG